MESKETKPSALKTFGVIAGILIALPVGFYLLWWLVVGLLSLFEVATIEPATFETKEARYVYKRTPIEDAFNLPDTNYRRAGDRVFFFDAAEEDDNVYALKSYDLKDASVATWTKFPRSGSPPVIVPVADSVYIYRSGEGLFRKSSLMLANEASSRGEKMAPPIPEDCGRGRDLSLGQGVEGVLAACLPHERESTLISVFLSTPGRPEWSDHSPTEPWKDGVVRSSAVDGNFVFLAGESHVYRFDVARRRMEPVGALKELLKDITYQPLLGKAGDAVFLAAGDDLLFWDAVSSSFKAAFEPSSKYTLWYDDYAAYRMYVQGGEALLQVSEHQVAARKGLGYFRKETSSNAVGTWVYHGVMEDVSFAQPVALSDSSFYYGDQSGLAVRDIGLKTCIVDAERVFGGAFDWIPKLAKGGTISGYVLNAAPELCRVDIAVPASLGDKGDFRSLRVSLASADDPSNFERVKVGDHVTATVARWEGLNASVDRMHVDLREGAPLPGQAPLNDRALTLAAILSSLAMGVVSLIAALRRMSRASRVLLAGLFPTEEAMRSAERLRTVGLAVVGVGFLALTAKLQGRPADFIGFLEAISLQVGVFWLLFSGLYYVAAMNLLKILRPKNPKIPVPPPSPSGR